MKRFLASVALLFSLSLIGCGGGEKGPADPNEIPEVNEAEVEKTIESGMPPEMKEKYGK